MLLINYPLPHGRGLETVGCSSNFVIRASSLIRHSDFVIRHSIWHPSPAYRRGLIDGLSIYPLMSALESAEMGKAIVDSLVFAWDAERR